MTDSEINALFFRSRRAHLLRLSKEKMGDIAEINRYRADFLKTHLQALQFKNG